MTLVLAPPNSGKSIFLKLLAGRVKGSGELQVMLWSYYDLLDLVTDCVTGLFPRSAC